MNKDNRRQAVAAVIQKSGKFLFVRRSDYEENAKGYWCPVTGGIEVGETQEQAIKREVKEEVGLDVVADKYICEISTQDNQYTLHFWTTRILSGDASICSNEATDLKWVTLEEMKNLKPTFDDDLLIHQNLDKNCR